MGHWKNITIALATGAVFLLSISGIANAQQGSWVRKDFNTDTNYFAQISFGAPGKTDLFWASCGDDETMGLSFGVDSSGLAVDAPTQVQVLVGNDVLQVDGKVHFTVNDRNTIVAYTTFNRPFWPAMVSADTMSLGIPGKPYETIDLVSGRDIIRNFVGICAHYQTLIGQGGPAAIAQAQAAQNTVAPAQTANDPAAYAEQFRGVWAFASSTHANCPGCTLSMGVDGTSILAAGSNCELLRGDVASSAPGEQTVYGSSIFTGPNVPVPLNGVERNAAFKLQNGQLVIDYSAIPGRGNGALSTNVRDVYNLAGPNNGNNPNTYLCSGGTPEQFVAALTADSEGASPQPQPAPSAAPTPNSDGLTTAEQVAVGVLAAGAAIVANEINNQFFTEAPPPVAPSGNTNVSLSVTIASVIAVETTFGIGGDEIFLLASNGQRFPADPSGYQSIDSGQVWAPGARFTDGGAISIDLREWDSFNASDLIGNLSVDASQGQGRYTTVFRGDGAEYEITYDVTLSGQVQSQPLAPSTPIAQNQSRIWSVTGAYESITAVDCRDDCEEDVGMIFMCRGAGLPAEVSVPWVSTEQGPQGAIAPLNINVDGKNFSYNAQLGPYGMVGHIPSFFVNPGDPLMEALSAGNNANISFDGTSTDIGLRGSRDALNIFQAHCDWYNVPPGTQFANGYPVTQQPAEPEVQPFWFTSQYNDFDTGQLTNGLTFGIPETDAIGVSASCQPGSANSNITLELMVDFGFQSNFDKVDAYLLLDGSAHEFEAEVFIGSSEYAGIRNSFSPSHPLWAEMQNAQHIVYGVVGAGRGTASTLGAYDAIGQFVASCAPAIPTVQSTPAQPVPQVPTPGAVNQGIFICDDGSSMSVALSEAGAAKVANITQTDGTQFALIEVPTNVGAKFSNGLATLNLSGQTAQFSANGVSLFCQAN